MKALVYTAPFTLAIQDVPIPEPAPHEVLVRVKAVGICGSDVHGYTGRTGRRIPPLIMGHEAAGVVAVTGTDVRTIDAGTPVCFDSTIYCNQCLACHTRQYNRCTKRSVLGVSAEGTKCQGAMAEYVRLPHWTLHRLPETLSFEVATLLEPLSIGMHAAARAGDLADSTVLIIGAGPIGLCALLAVKLFQPRSVIVADLSEARLAAAHSLGADIAVHPDHIPFSHNPGIDTVFEAAGTAKTLNLAIRAVRMGGTIVAVGNTVHMPPFDVQSVVSKELTVIGSYASAGEYAHALEQVASGTVDPRPLISDCVPLTQGAVCFERLHKGDDRLLKLVLNP